MGISYIACSAVQYFSTLSDKWYEFWKKKIEIKICVFFSLRILSEMFFILRRIERDIIINVYRSSCTVAIILVRFLWNLNFLDRFSKNVQISNFMKIHSVEVELFHADRRTDMTKLIVALRNFANATRNLKLQLHATSVNGVTSNHINLFETLYQIFWTFRTGN
jgi:hypothetical protein